MGLEHGAAAAERAHAGEQLAHQEGRGQHVVRAGVEHLDAVTRGKMRGDHQNGERRAALLPQRTQGAAELHGKLPASLIGQQDADVVQPFRDLCGVVVKGFHIVV